MPTGAHPAWLPNDAFADVTNSVELMQVLRSRLRIELAALLTAAAIFVIETGSVELEAVKRKFDGSFDLEGWTMGEGGRTSGVKRVRGVFTALKVND